MAAILLLLPLIAVSAVSAVALIVSRTVATSLQAEQDERTRIEAIQTDLHDVALEGTSFLAARGPDEQAAMAKAAKRVDAELAPTMRPTGLTQSQTVMLADVDQAWSDSLGIRQVILAEDPSVVPSADATRFLEERLTTRMADMWTQAGKVKAISAGEEAALAREVNLVDRVSPAWVTLALLFGLGAGWWLSRRLARSIMLPLSTLTQAAERIAAGKQSSGVALHGPLEIEVLGSAFNDMADQLAER